MIKSFKFADNKPYNKNTYPIKELMSHGGDRNYIPPKNNKPYCIAVREDFKLIAKKAKEEAEEINKIMPHPYRLESESNIPEESIKNMNKLNAKSKSNDKMI